MTIDQYAITSLSRVKTHLGIEGVDDDALLEHLINAATAKIETLTDRKWKSRTLREWHQADAPGCGYLMLRNFPVTAVKRISYGEATAFTLKGTTTTDLRATVEVQDDQLILSRFASTGTETASTLTFASNATASALVTAINLLSGWTATLVNNWVSLDLYRQSGTDAKGVTVDVTYPDESGAFTRVEEETGILHFDLSGYGVGYGGDSFAAMNVLVEYTGGYTAVLMPYDVEQICIELTQQAYNARDKDQSVISERLGDYSVTLMSQVQLTADTRERLAEHRRRLS